MNHFETHSTIMLNGFTGLSLTTIASLIKCFGSAGAAIKAGVNAWREIIGDDWENLQAEWDAVLRVADAELKEVEKQSLRVYLAHVGPYPMLLKELYAPPPIIYVKGEDICTNTPAIALVGSRRCSFYGEKIAAQLSADLAVLGITTVSGLARGIDSVVHRETLKSGGKTWAVLGSGLLMVYPPENRRLAAEIAASGALISEFPLSLRPYPGNFPRRNRIIAGLAMGTVVVEGDEKSGSLITARLAIDEGREVFAVPGPLTSPLSKGPHALLKTGAKLVESVHDILSEFSHRPEWNSLPFFQQAAPLKVIPEHQEILEVLGGTAVAKDALSARIKKDPMQLATILFQMEIEGLIRLLPGGLVVKT